MASPTCTTARNAAVPKPLPTTRVNCAGCGAFIAVVQTVDVEAWSGVLKSLHGCPVGQ